MEGRNNQNNMREWQNNESGIITGKRVVKQKMRVEK